MRKLFRSRKLRFSALAAGLVTMAFALNWVVQVWRKPTELFFPVSGVLNKTPAETWRQYGPAFRAHSTAIMTPELLAALAQVEGAGNPVAQTYWRWRLTHQPFEVYRPASSAVGMYQITDARFAEARRLCVHGNVATDDCWFNFLYVRTVPSHAVEMTSAFLDRDRRWPGMVTPAVVRAFAEIGWGWGGSWRTLKDYQHFSRDNR